MKNAARLILIIVVGILSLTGCTQSTISKNYIKPVKLSSSEQELIDLVKMDDQIALFEFDKSPEVGNLSVVAESYVDGELVNTQPIMGIGLEASEKGKVVLVLNKGEHLSVQIKQSYSKGTVATHSEIPLDFIDGEIIGWSYGFLEETIDLEKNTKPIIGFYVFSESGMIRASAVSGFEVDPELLKEAENIVLFRVIVE